jgi:NAD(P) transhydrogenase subunit beta
MPEATISEPVQLGIDFAYLITGVCFIMGLRYMNSPKTARLGNYVSIAGMAIALLATSIALDWSSGSRSSDSARARASACTSRVR